MILSASPHSLSSFAKLIIVVENLFRLCRPLQAELCSIEFLYLPCYETMGLP